MSDSRSVQCLCVLFCLVILFAPVRAQNVNGTIVGVVTDASGSVVTTARVALTNERTNSAFVTKTDETGTWTAPSLAPGSYTVRVEAQGFKPHVLAGFELLSGQTARADVSLETGTLMQAVEVRATAPVVSSETSAIGSVIEGAAIVNLPLNGRGFDQLVLLAAGVTQTDNASNPRIGGSPYWGGTQFNVDGGTFQDPGNGGSPSAFGQGLKIGPSIDAVSEFRMDSNSQKAEFDGSVAVTVITKSGSNEFHGSLFEFNRNKAYASRNPNLPGSPKAPFNRNEFGFSLGGPVVRNKTFFFGSYEGLRQRSPTFVRYAVAPANWRSGDFSGAPAIVDPLAGRPFTNNQIPADRIDSRAKALLDFVPLPNQAPIGDINYWSGNIANRTDIDRMGFRLDHTLFANSRLTGSFDYSAGDPIFSVRQAPPTFGHFENAGFKQMRWNVAYNHVFTPNTLNETRAVYFYYRPTRVGSNGSFDPRTLFPDLYGPFPVGGLPRVAINFHGVIGDYGGDAGLKIYSDQFIDNFTHVHGRHTIKMGIDIARHRFGGPPTAFGYGSGLANDSALGSFNFTGRYTNNNAAAAAAPAHAFADFLLGYAASTGRATPSITYLNYFWRHAAYVQDDWQVSRRLTLNFGLRYAYQTPFRERDDTQANFDPRTGNLVFPGDSVPKQAIPALLTAFPFTTASKSGWGDLVVTTDKANFAPRFGFALRPFADNKTVIRAGAGLYYNQVPMFIGGRQLGFTNPPFLLAESFIADPGSTPNLTLAHPFGATGTFASNPVITAVDHELKNSLSQQWNLTFERELVSSFGARVSYVGNKTSHLPWYNRPLNEPREQSAAAIQPRRPYQPWSGINLLATGGDSILHQLQIEFNKRYSHGFVFQTQYSFNRSIDDVPIVGGPQNPYDNAADRGNSDGIQRHIFTLNGNYELPFGPGKLLGRNSGPLGKIIGGWQIGTITRLRTGSPFSVAFTSTRPGWSSGRADRIGDGKVDNPTRDRWFDPSAFVVPAAYTYGNGGRNILFAPGRIGIDLSLLKNTAITERVSLQLRGEFFNAPNHSDLAAPAANISVPSQVGRISSVNGGREVQLAAKLLF